jgi:cytoskeleton protein RodZ
VASFGVRLKEQREQRGITLEEISSTTKIGTRMLVALEQDHFDQLPGGIFNKGFIRAYARCVGMDEDQAIADYLIASGNLPSEKEKDKRSDGVVEPAFELQANAEGRESTLPWGTFAILLLLVALGFVAWSSYSSKARRSSTKTLAPIPASTPAFVAPTNSATPVSTPPAPAPTQVAQPSISKPLSLKIALHAESWLSITADGHPVLQGSSFSAPTQKTIHAEREIVVKAGNVGALDLEFNGKKLPAQGTDGEVKSLTFDAAGVHQSAPSPMTSPQQP